VTLLARLHVRVCVGDGGVVVALLCVCVYVSACWVWCIFCAVEKVAAVSEVQLTYVRQVPTCVTAESRVGHSFSCSHVSPHGICFPPQIGVFFLVYLSVSHLSFGPPTHS
jgi:hypothetical protein